MTRPLSSGEFEERRFPIGFEGQDLRLPKAQKCFDLDSRAIAALHPHDLRRETVYQAALVEVRVFRDDREAVRARVLPDIDVGLGRQPKQSNVRRPRVDVAQLFTR